MMKSERPQQPQDSETEGLYLKSLDPGGCSWPFEDAISSSGITNAHIAQAPAARTPAAHLGRTLHLLHPILKRQRQTQKFCMSLRDLGFRGQDVTRRV